MKKNTKSEEITIQLNLEEKDSEFKKYEELIVLMLKRDVSGIGDYLCKAAEEPFTVNNIYQRYTSLRIKFSKIRSIFKLANHLNKMDAEDSLNSRIVKILVKKINKSTRKLNSELNCFKCYTLNDRTDVDKVEILKVLNLKTFPIFLGNGLVDETQTFPKSEIKSISLGQILELGQNSM